MRVRKLTCVNFNYEQDLSKRFQTGVTFNFIQTNALAVAQHDSRLFDGAC